MTRSEISKIHWLSDSPGSHVANGPAEDAEAETEDGHVAEIERRLEEAVHPAGRFFSWELNFNDF